MRISDWSSDVCSSDLTLWATWIGFTPDRLSVVVRVGFERSGLGAVHSGLIPRFPLAVRHAVNVFARLVLAHRRALGIGGFTQPVGQAVAAKAGQIHQIDVLHVGALAPVLKQTTKGQLGRTAAREEGEQ